MNAFRTTLCAAILLSTLAKAEDLVFARILPTVRTVVCEIAGEGAPEAIRFIRMVGKNAFPQLRFSMLPLWTIERCAKGSSHLSSSLRP